MLYIELEEELVGQNFELKQPLGIGSTFESVIGILGNPTYTLNSWISYAFEIANGKLKFLKTKSDMNDSNSNTYTMTFLLEDNKVKLINLAFYPFG